MTEIDYTRKCSQYLSIVLCNNPEYEEWLLSDGNLKRRYPLTGLYSALGFEAAKAQSFNDLLRTFRRFKQRHFLRIATRDFCHYADLSETTGQLSDLASVALQVGLDVLSAHPDWWAWNEELDVWRRLGGKIPLVVLGLGKLGGHELNYVSDVDLICLNPESNEDGENFIMLLSRLTHRLSRLLSDRFEGDRVFQVDFRLRPQGKQGILVPSMSGALEHYLLRGRAWERQMLLKCRPVAGERSEGSAFVRELRPFVFRRFLDFQAIAELREMRSRILTEAVPFRPGARRFDVKLGIGGIREVEFLVQSMQLIYGGRHPELDEPNTLKCLEKLSGLGLLPQGTAEELKGSYTFLRNVEHYIQLDQNRQTQSLPHSEKERMRLVFAMGFGDDEIAFLKELEMHCSIVHSRFQELFQEKPEEGEDLGSEKLRHGLAGGWGGSPLLARGDFASTQPGRSASPPAELFDKLQETLKAYPASVKSEILFGALEKFSGVCDRELLEKILVRMDTYFGRVARRTGLIKLFGAVKPWMAPFCQLIASSELAAALLSHNPALVEGHAVRSGIFSPARQWEQSSLGLVERAEEYGEKLEWIRRLKNERIIQLALADLGGRIDFAALETEQTTLADFVIRNTLAAVRQNLGLPADLPLSVLGMGKLGSGEMSYLSDLDLVFVYAPRAHEPANQIPGEVVRLIQRFINMLYTPLQEGPGYPMDVRLRPTGTHGPLVVTCKAWLEYYEAQADIWEIQALLRIRHIAGDPELGQWIEDKAGEICCRKRSQESVWPRLRHLRNRMEKERAAETETEIDLKLGMGGLADIEFMVQAQLLVGGAFIPPFSKGQGGPAMPHSTSPPFSKGGQGGFYEHTQLRPSDNNLLSGGARPTPCRSVRRALQEFLKNFPKLRFGGTRLDQICAAFGALRALDHRVRLHTNSSAAKLDERRFEAMVSLGLWPPHFDGS
ncbi:MAG TPA: bifunctional [glutamate--ammonia ligase]-adenylyl-L-tyrosine phosphorylase/[glutamate--ammonia-ligase] adenylyltransferase, partial [Deltaproteobacteria bacterium]|nr:bifunctional [glutamate--ammonia ligase]-adenylyl-L-tyrosine phosphorylase/[glutamate--ammonia-ligase] adenylyltransferase [Deltaproteobacteria bacterium]